MEYDGIVPAIIGSVPESKITVTYPNGKEVDLGQELTPAEAKTKPELKWDITPGKLYTLLMLDLDAPSKSFPFLSPINHWLVYNTTRCDLSDGDTVADYAGPGPPKFTGFHRYIFFVFEHEEKLVCEDRSSSRTARMRFAFEKWRKKYNLNNLVAWNYFNAKR